MTEVASSSNPGLQVLSVRHYEAAPPANLTQDLVSPPGLVVSIESVKFTLLITNHQSQVLRWFDVLFNASSALSQDSQDVVNGPPCHKPNSMESERGVYDNVPSTILRSSLLYYDVIKRPGVNPL